MGIVIDTHVHLYDIHEPSWNSPPFAGDDLIKVMDGPFYLFGEKRRVDIALAQPTPGVTILKDWDFQKQHECVVQAVRKYPDRVIGVMMINPHFGVDEALLELERLVRDEGFRAVKLHPAFHRFFPNKSRHFTDPIMKKARELNLTVIIHTGEPPYSVPAQVVPLAENYPDVNIMLAHMGIQWISYSADAINVAYHYKNVYLQIDWAPLNRLKEAVDTLGVDRLLLASDSPYTDIGGYFRLMEVLTMNPPLGMNLTRQDIDKILGENCASLMGLSPA